MKVYFSPQFAGLHICPRTNDGVFTIPCATLAPGQRPLDVARKLSKMFPGDVVILTTPMKAGEGYILYTGACGVNRSVISVPYSVMMEHFEAVIAAGGN